MNSTITVSQKYFKEAKMRNYQDFLQIDCKVYNLNNITEELFNMRENFCNGDCKHCLIHENYYYKGLSCNEALNKYPNECIKIFGGYNNV